MLSKEQANSLKLQYNDIAILKTNFNALVDLLTISDPEVKEVVLEKPKIVDLVEKLEETKNIDILKEVEQEVAKPQEDIEELKAKFMEKFGKEVPVNMKNNATWIKEKLAK